MGVNDLLILTAGFLLSSITVLASTCIRVFARWWVEVEIERRGEECGMEAGVGPRLKDGIWEPRRGRLVLWRFVLLGL